MALPSSSLLSAGRRRRLVEAGARPGRLRLSGVDPMLAGAARPFSRAGWVFELKYDGFRLLAGRRDGRVALRLRGGSDATLRFPEVARAVETVRGDDFVLDGEMVALDGQGRPEFNRLQKRFLFRRRGDIAEAAREWPCCAYAFDLLAVDGLDLRHVPLLERKAALREVVAGSAVRYVDHVEEAGEDFYREVAARGLEGVMAKRALSRYAAGRSADWLKFRIQQTGDFVVVGFTAPGLGREGGLHLASASGRRLVYAGRVGTGFEAGALGAAREILAERALAAPPCVGAVPRGAGHTWVEPRVVCEVRFLEQTSDGLLRHPVFVRFRPDKGAGRGRR